MAATSVDRAIDEARETYREVKTTVEEAYCDLINAIDALRDAYNAHAESEFGEAVNEDGDAWEDTEEAIQVLRLIEELEKVANDMTLPDLADA